MATINLNHVTFNSGGTTFSMNQSGYISKIRVSSASDIGYSFNVTETLTNTISETGLVGGDKLKTLSGSVTIPVNDMKFTVETTGHIDECIEIVYPGVGWDGQFGCAVEDLDSKPKYWNSISFFGKRWSNDPNDPESITGTVVLRSVNDPTKTVTIDSFVLSADYSLPTPLVDFWYNIIETAGEVTHWISDVPSEWSFQVGPTAVHPIRNGLIYYENGARMSLYSNQTMTWGTLDLGNKTVAWKIRLDSFPVSNLGVFGYGGSPHTQFRIETDNQIGIYPDYKTLDFDPNDLQDNKIKVISTPTKMQLYGVVDDLLGEVIFASRSRSLAQLGTWAGAQYPFKGWIERLTIYDEIVDDNKLDTVAFNLGT